MAQLAPIFVQKYTDSNGLPLAGGKLYSYAAGTSTPQATYTDQSGVTPNANPVVLDSQGKATIWLSALAYKFVLQDSLGNVLQTADNVSTIDPSSITNSKLATMTALTFKANATAGTTNPQDITPAVAASMLPTFVGDSGSGGTKGLVPAPAAGDGAAGKTLHADGTWSVPSVVEVVFKNYGEYFKSGVIQGTPQFPWSAPTFLANPDTIPTGNGNGCHFSSDMNMLAVAHTTTPFLSVYARSGVGFSKLPNPSVLPPSNAQAIAWSPGGSFLAVSSSTTGSGNGFLTIYARVGASLICISNNINPNTLNSANGAGLTWSPDGQFLAVASDTSPFVNIYRITQNLVTAPTGTYLGPSLTGTAHVPNPTPGTTTVLATAFNTYLDTDNSNLTILAAILNTIPQAIVGFGALSSPGTTPTGAAAGVAWSPDGQFLVVAHSTTPFITIYQRVGTTFTKLSNPATLPTGNATAAAFSPDNSYLVVTHNTTPFVTIYAITFPAGVATFTKVSNPTTLPASTGRSVTWSPNGKLLAIGHDTTPFITIYSLASGVFTKIADPANLVGAAAYGLSWSANGKILAVAAQTTPYINFYATASPMPTNATLFASVIPDV